MEKTQEKDEEQSEEQLEVPQEEIGDLTLADFTNPEALLHLGIITAALIEKFGTATFVLDEYDGVSYVNPIHVFLTADARTPDGKVPQRVRPVIISGRPQFVEVDQDGTVWEVEYVNPEPEPEPESSK